MSRISEIDILRGVSIIGVLFHHLFFQHFRYGLSGDALPFPITIIASSGWLGVNLFFFVSGFVLYLPYALGKRSFSTWANVGQFYLHRAGRLMPLYYVGAAVAIAASGISVWTPEFWKTAADFLLVTYPFSPSTFMPPGNWVMWSIGVEVWFSALFPLLVLAAGRYGVVKSLAAAILVSLAVRIIGRGALSDHESRLVLHFVSDSVLGRLDEFAYGMVAAHLYARKVSIRGYVAAFGLACIAVSLYLWSIWYCGELPYMSVPFLSMPLDLGLVLCVGHLLGRRFPVPSYMWPIELLGAMCYSIYMWHGMMLNVMRDSIARYPSSIALYLFATLAVSTLTFKLIERQNFPPIRQARRSPNQASPG